MLAYDKIKLENEALISEAKALYKMRFISKTQLADIATRLSSMHSNGNILVRIGFFLLGCFLFSSVMGSFMLLFAPLMENNYKVMVYFYALIGLAGAELLAIKNYHKHGLDDAFILSMQVAFCVAIGVSFEATLPVFIAMFIVGMVCCIRYVHTLSALVGCVGIVGFFFDLVVNHGLIDKLFLPFIGFVLACGLYFISLALEKIEHLYLYSYAIQVVKGFALLLAYFSVNYMVVRELSENLMNIVVTNETDIPLAFLFYGLTFIVPLFYICYALFTKDRLMLLLGLFALGFSVFTIRYYYQVMPLETALILGGMLIFVISYLAIQKLKDREAGLTFLPARGSDSSLILNAQALIIASQIQTKRVTSRDKMPFGGGGFSGGGAGETF